MNKKGQGRLGWIIILLIVFIIINKTSLWLNGSTLDATSQWISIIIISLIETGIFWVVKNLEW